MGKRGKLGQKEPTFLGLTDRVREERKRRVKSFLPRSTEFHWSVFVGAKNKSSPHRQGLRMGAENANFVEVPDEKFRKSKGSSLGIVPGAS